MTQWLISYDRYGYVIDLQNIDGWDEKDIRKYAAACQNYWWEKGGLENLENAMSGNFEYRKGDRDTIEEWAEILNCHIAWHNGSNHCQCGYHDCPQYQAELKTFYDGQEA